MIKTCLTVGVTAEGDQKCLYCGPDAVAARNLLGSPPEGIVETLFFKRPHPTKRRRGHGPIEAVEELETSEAEDADSDEAESALNPPAKTRNSRKKK